MATIAGPPRAFTVAADQMRNATLRSELKTREIAAPERIAPYSIALAAGVARGNEDDHDSDVVDSIYGAGRIILMYLSLIHI